MSRFLRINVENKNYLEIELRGDLQAIMIYKYNDKGDMINSRMISEREFVDLYNILVYAQDHNGIDIDEFWRVIDESN